MRAEKDMACIELTVERAAVRVTRNLSAKEHGR